MAQQLLLGLNITPVMQQVINNMRNLIPSVMPSTLLNLESTIEDHAARYTEVRVKLDSQPDIATRTELHKELRSIKEERRRLLFQLHQARKEAYKRHLSQRTTNC